VLLDSQKELVHRARFYNNWYNNLYYLYTIYSFIQFSLLPPSPAYLRYAPAPGSPILENIFFIIREIYESTEEHFPIQCLVKFSQISIFILISFVHKRKGCSKKWCVREVKDILCVKVAVVNLPFRKYNIMSIQCVYKLLKSLPFR